MKNIFLLTIIVFSFSCSSIPENENPLCKLNQTKTSEESKHFYDCNFNLKKYNKLINIFGIKDVKIKRKIFLTGLSVLAYIDSKDYNALLYDIDNDIIYNYVVENNVIKTEKINGELLNKIYKTSEFYYLIWQYKNDITMFNKIIENLKTYSDTSGVHSRRYFYFINSEMPSENYFSVFWNTEP
ncbi:hypothetical protein [Chryseobacterium sp. SC28]|uniref:hypothetical protein n=1 Tax=Chryseobacterium sp. SC28 TaxID=2268028 RepID=UPI000F64A6AA|nr:hypothetical protein [Chryseobacterium sp. SC28]RRQ45494.1 hypothetical protein DTW91_10015 [Chryseobacterium sp. SC28]